MSEEQKKNPIMPETQKRQVQAMNSNEILNFQIRLQVECDMTQEEAADYITQAFN